MKEYYTLRETAKALDLSDIWVRRMLTKEEGLLGGKGAKVNGTWRIPTKVVESLKKQYETKRETTLRRKLGEIPKYTFKYVPDRVKACKLVPILLKEYKTSLTPQEVDKVVQACKKIEEAERKLYNDRKKERNSKKEGK